MQFKLENMNKGRTVEQVDEQFLRTYNLIRVQANLLIHAHYHAEDHSKLLHVLTDIQERLNELLFQDAHTLRRMYEQISGLDEFNKCTTDDQKLALIREVFSTHVAIRLFANAEISRVERQTGLLAKDNLQELINKTEKLLNDSLFKQMLVKVSGCELHVVTSALADDIGNPTQKKAVVEALGQVAQGLIERLPKRNYENSNDAKVSSDHIPESWAMP